MLCPYVYIVPTDVPIVDCMLILKLFLLLLSSAGPSSPPAQTNVATIDWLGSEQLSKVGSSSLAAQPSLSTNAVGAAMDFSQSSCRPWERGDLLHRLATFKPSTWASKPKVASSLIGPLVKLCHFLIYN
jgi:hypothetical protein